MEAHDETRTRPGFFATLGILLGAVVRNAGTCAALAAPPAVLIGASAGAMETVAGLEEGGGSFAAGLAAGAMGIAALGTIVLTGILVYPLSAAGLAWVGVRAVAEERTGPGEALARVIERGPAAIGAFLLAVLAIIGAPLVVGLLTLVAAGALGEGVAIPLSILLLASLVWPAFVYWVRLSVAVPAVVTGDASSSTSALGRSVELVRGGFWWVFGVLAVTSIGAAIVGGIVGAPFGTASPAAVGVGQTMGLVVSIATAGVTAGVVYGVRRLPEEAPPERPEADQVTREGWPSSGI